MIKLSLTSQKSGKIVIYSRQHYVNQDTLVWTVLKVLLQQWISDIAATASPQQTNKFYPYYSLD